MATLDRIRALLLKRDRDAEFVFDEETGILFWWNRRKERSNRKDHGIAFERACFVFYDEEVQFHSDRQEDDETRLWAVGRVEEIGVVVVVHTVKHYEEIEVIRIISAREASEKEQLIYYYGEA